MNMYTKYLKRENKTKINAYNIDGQKIDKAGYKI